MAVTVRSHAKINLGLGIGAPRADGFHALATVYQTLELHDLVTVAARPATTTELRISSNDGRVPRDSRNTAWKMVGSCAGPAGDHGPGSRFILKSGCRFRADWVRARQTRWRHWSGWRRSWVGGPGSGIRDRGSGVRDRESGIRVGSQGSGGRVRGQSFQT